MTLHPTLHETTSHEFHAMVDTLIGLLGEVQRTTRRFADLVGKRLGAVERGDRDTVENCLETQSEALIDLVLAERERVACLTEIGLSVGHRRPSRLRLAELVLYVRPDQRDELLDVRERLRDVADDLDGLGSASLTFRRMRSGAMTLYVAAGVATPALFDEPSAFDTVPTAEAVCVEDAVGASPDADFQDAGLPSAEHSEPTPLELAELDALVHFDDVDAFGDLGELTELAEGAEDREISRQDDPPGAEFGPSNRISPFADEF